MEAPNLTFLASAVEEAVVQEVEERKDEEEFNEGHYQPSIAPKLDRKGPAGLLVLRDELVIKVCFG